jgi:hypothetical protein
MSGEGNATEKTATLHHKAKNDDDYKQLGGKYKPSQLHSWWTCRHIVQFSNAEVNIVMLSQYSHGLRAGGPGFDSRQDQYFSLLHSVQTGSGAHPASYPMGTGCSFPGGKATGA